MEKTRTGGLLYPRLPHAPASDTEAFNIATRDFYARYPGFCPVQGGFLAASDRAVYLTLAARGNEVRGFVYDQSRRPKLTFAYFEGQSSRVLERQACPTQRN